MLIWSLKCEALDPRRNFDFKYKLYNYLLLYAKQKSFSVYDIEDYDISSLADEVYVIFFVSTSGEGDVPLSMRSFWNLILRRTLPPNCLSHIKHAVFGLGDSSYEFYNAAARFDR